VDRQGCLKSGCAQVLDVRDHGWSSATTAGPWGRAAVQWTLDKAHILGNAIDTRSTSQRSLMNPWGAP